MPITKGKNLALWTIQILLAALFLYAGGMKLVMPAAVLSSVAPLPVGFMRFIGTAEVLGAAGLILPGLLRIHTILTPVAAGGLVIIMIGAVIVTVLTSPAALAILPFVTGVLAATIAYTRWRVAPLGSSAGAAAA